MKNTAIICALLSVLFLASCGTLNGMGQDLERAGQYISDTF